MKRVHVRPDLVLCVDLPPQEREVGKSNTVEIECAFDREGHCALDCAACVITKGIEGFEGKRFVGCLRLHGAGASRYVLPIGECLEDLSWIDGNEPENMAGTTTTSATQTNHLPYPRCPGCKRVRSNGIVVVKGQPSELLCSCGTTYRLTAIGAWPHYDVELVKEGVANNDIKLPPDYIEGLDGLAAQIKLEGTNEPVDGTVLRGEGGKHYGLVPLLNAMVCFCIGVADELRKKELPAGGKWY